MPEKGAGDVCLDIFALVKFKLKHDGNVIYKSMYTEMLTLCVS